MEITDAATHAASGAGGVLSMGYIAKILIQNWIRKQDQKSDEVGKAIQGVAVELAKVGVKLEGLQRSAEATNRYGEAIAVLQTKVEDLSRCINGLGQKVRAISSNGPTS